MQIDYNKIPDEMKAYRQWLVWRYEERDAEKPTKVPYSALTGQLASVTDPSTWCSFDEAVAAIPRGFSGIGFVLTKNDPYTFIDLDEPGKKLDAAATQVIVDRQIKIYQEFDSYSERSPSGTGLHIIVKGHVLNGRRRSSIELYSSERYMTMTGVVFNDKPIVERQSLVQLLWAQMGGGAAAEMYDGDSPETLTDAQVIERGLAAANGVKFRGLLEGRWGEFYPSQSEADFAFVDIIAFYTQNRNQIMRIFRASPLGQRDKAQRDDYVKRMVLRAFDRLLPPIDFVGLEATTAAAQPQLKEIAGTVDKAISGGAPQAEIRKFWQPVPITPPPGLLGEIAQFIYAAAPRAVAEMAICGAIGMLAGITGRAYNVSGTGLNQYVLLVAPTGTGKEAIAGGVSKLLNAIKSTIPASESFRGPAEIASGQALLKQLTKVNPCFASIVGEFGLKLQQLASPRASTSEIMLKRVLLDLYNKSGATDTLAPSIYADKDKNTPSVKSPSVSIVGETTPETLYSAMDESLISDGLLPRFMIIEYTGKRPRRNKQASEAKPGLVLIERLAEICAHSLTLQHNERVVNIEAEPDALAFMDKIDELVDDAINATQTDALRHLWNRAHIKTLKLAALVAVGCNYTHPLITLEHAQWAYNVVSTDIIGIVGRFTKGEVGKNTEENKQGKTILRVCAEYLTSDYRDVQSYNIDQSLHTAKIIPYSYISRRIITNSVFRNDKAGSTNAIKRTVQGLIDSGDLQEVGKNQLQQSFSYSGRAFAIARPDKLPASM